MRESGYKNVLLSHTHTFSGVCSYTHVHSHTHTHTHIHSFSCTQTHIAAVLVAAIRDRPAASLSRALSLSFLLTISLSRSLSLHIYMENTHTHLHCSLTGRHPSDPLQLSLSHSLIFNFSLFLCTYIFLHKPRGRTRRSQSNPLQTSLSLTPFRSLYMLCIFPHKHLTAILVAVHQIRSKWECQFLQRVAGSLIAGTWVVSQIWMSNLYYGVATISRLLKIIRLFCKRAL